MGGIVEARSLTVARLVVTRFSRSRGQVTGQRRRAKARNNQEGGQALVEWVLTNAGIILPTTFILIFTAQLLWVWHSAQEWTRDGARYAATHCYQGGGANVQSYMRTHVPVNVDQTEFQGGTAELVISYFGKDPDTGDLSEFTCAGSECSTDCIPDAVTVRVTGYEFRTFMSYLGLPPVIIPDFATSVAIESAGCDPDQGTCLP